MISQIEDLLIILNNLAHFLAFKVLDFVTVNHNQSIHFLFWLLSIFLVNYSTKEDPKKEVKAR